MRFESKYDTFYGGDKPRRAPSRPPIGIPRNRFDAILAERPSGGALLDIGCGEGQLLYELGQAFERLVGLEFSPGRLDAARQCLAGFDFTAVCGSAEDMAQIASSTIDCIICADVIEHVPDVYSAADEMFRVLKSGGSLIINTPNVAFLVKRLRLLVGRFPSTSQANEGLGSDVLFDGGHLHYFTFRSLRLLLERSRFVIAKATGFGPLGRIHRVCPSLLATGIQLVATKPG